MRFIERHHRLLIGLLLLAVLLAAASYRRIVLREDVTVMAPASLAPALTLFQNSPLAKKIFIVVKADTAAAAREAADHVSEHIAALDAAAVSAPKMDSASLLALCRREMPRLWNAELERLAGPLLQPAAVQKSMAENWASLAGPEGMFLQPWITADPLHLLPLYANRLKSLQAGDSLDATGGYLTSPDGLKILLIFDSAGNKFDAQAADKMTATLHDLMRPYAATAFLMGSARYTAENKAIIARDLARVLALSAALMLALFLVFFRERRAVLIYLIPPVTVLIAAVGTSLIFGGLSGITLGFSAVLLGMASDYATYVYFALRAGAEPDRRAIVRRLAPTVALSAATLALAFSLLALSGIRLFQQLAVFVVIGLGVEWFVAMGVAPAVFACAGKREAAWGKTRLARPLLGLKSAAIILLALLLGGAASLPWVRFNFRLDALNTVSPRFERERLEFDDLTGHVGEKNSFLFVFGESKEAALQNNERLSAALPGGLKMASLFVSEKTAAQNLQRWRTFWSPARQAALQADLEREAASLGLKPAAFAPFFDWLKTGGEEEPAPAAEQANEDEPAPAPTLENLYNPFVATDSAALRHLGRVAIVNLIPENDPLLAQPALNQASEAAAAPALLVSQAEIHRALIDHVRRNIGLMMGALLLGGGLLLRWQLRDFRHALACFLPGLCGIALFFATLAALQTECNLFGFFILPMIVGLGLNYGIFIVEQQAGGGATHPTKAVVATALSTLAGFGSLIIAQHKVLFVMGLGAFVGVLTAIVVSVLLLPPLVRKSSPPAAPSIDANPLEPS